MKSLKVKLKMRNLALEINWNEVSLSNKMIKTKIKLKKYLYITQHYLK